MIWDCVSREIEDIKDERYDDAVGRLRVSCYALHRSLCILDGTYKYLQGTTDQ